MPLLLRRQMRDTFQLALRRYAAGSSGHLLPQSRTFILPLRLPKD